MISHQHRDFLQPVAHGRRVHAIAGMLLLLSLIWLPVIPGHAFDTRFSGFGTVSLSCFSSDDADYVLNFQPEGPGRTQTCSAGLDSNLGGQLDVYLNDAFELGLQGVLHRDADGKYTPDIHVAQFRWHVMEGTTLRLGRSPYPAFLNSESRRVRFTQPWVRPPTEVYSILPMTEHDGLEVVHRRLSGDWELEWHAGLGWFDEELPTQTGELAEVYGGQGFVNLSLLNDDWLLKGSYVFISPSVTSDSTNQLFAALRGFGAGSPAATLADDMAISHTPTHAVSFGLRYTPDDWLLQSELAYRLMEGSFFRDQLGIYATLGHRYGPWLPYATVARRWTSGKSGDLRSPLAFKSATDALFNSSVFDTTSLSVGVSRELTDQMTLKTQLDWVMPDDNSLGLYRKHGTGYDRSSPDSDVLFTVSLDFIF